MSVVVVAAGWSVAVVGLDATRENHEEDVVAQLTGVSLLCLLVKIELLLLPVDHPSDGRESRAVIASDATTVSVSPFCVSA